MSFWGWLGSDRRLSQHEHILQQRKGHETFYGFNSMIDEVHIYNQGAHVSIMPRAMGDG